MFIPPITAIVGFDPFPCWLFKGLLVPLLHDFVSALALTCASDERTIMGNQTRGQGRRSDPVNPCDIFHNHHKSSDMIQEKHERSRGLVRLYGLVNHPPKNIYILSWWWPVTQPSQVVAPWCGSPRCYWSRSAMAAAILRWTPALGQRSWATPWNLVPRKQFSKVSQEGQVMMVIICC